MSDFPPNGGYTDAPQLEKNEIDNRVHIEFYCQECDHYIYVWLNLKLSGNHVMNCPNCKHKHYRVVKNGVISSDRFNEDLPEKHEIVATQSACVPSSQRRNMGSIARQREAEATGLAK